MLQEQFTGFRLIIFYRYEVRQGVINQLWWASIVEFLKKKWNMKWKLNKIFILNQSEAAFREQATKFGIDYDGMCVTDNTACVADP